MDNRNQGWNQIGNEIKDLVQDAVNSRDYSQLNESITRTVRQAMDQVNRGLQNAASNMAGERKYEEYVDPDPREQSRKRPRDNGVPHGSRAAENGERIRFTDRWVNQPVPRREQAGPFARVVGLRARAYAQAAAGGVLTAGFGVGFLIALVALAVSSSSAGTAVGAAVLFLLVCGSLGLLIRGLRKIGFLNRFRQYTRILKERSYCELEDLAKKTGKSLKFIKKDLHRMLDKGWFLQGRLDKEETCLMVTDEAYEQYQTAQKQYEERIRREALFKEKEKTLTPEAEAILQEGRNYLEKIRICNDRIPGEEISRKISRMELLVQRIFEQVKKQPEAAEDMKKMMSYYLPTTVKLLDAYADMDVQPVQGENITTAKKEIEATLDTLNLAFEKLLDEIFKDMAWDVSTDISVLHTLLAQEGLTKDDF